MKSVKFVVIALVFFSFGWFVSESDKKQNTKPVPFIVYENPITKKLDTIPTFKLTKDKQGFHGGGYYKAIMPIDSSGKDSMTLYFSSRIFHPAFNAKDSCFSVTTTHRSK